MQFIIIKTLSEATIKTMPMHYKSQKRLYYSYLIKISDIVEDDDGNLKVEISNTEAGYRCIFRHIRNAFAHNNVFFFENGNILMKDYQRKDDK